MTVDQFHLFANRLREYKVEFIVEPHLRFKVRHDYHPAAVVGWFGLTFSSHSPPALHVAAAEHLLPREVPAACAAVCSLLVWPWPCYDAGCVIHHIWRCMAFLVCRCARHAHTRCLYGCVWRTFGIPCMCRRFNRGSLGNSGPCSSRTLLATIWSSRP